MIVRVYGDTVSQWSARDEASIKQCGQFAAYGAERDFLCFYEDENGNRLSVMDGAATLRAVGDTDEMLLFLTMDPTIHTVRTDRETAQRLSLMWGVSCDSEAVMEAPDHAVIDSHVVICNDLRSIYDVLTESFGSTALPPFDVWYADVHHRVRHGVCRVVGVYEKNECVACAMTVSECADAAHIGAVATRPIARGKGYASACVLTLTAMLQQENKRVLLSPKNAYARTLYAKIGFRVIGEWGCVHKQA